MSLTHDMKSAKVAMSCSASGGWLNMGDTAMAQNIIARLKTINPPTEIVCLSERLDRTLEKLEVSHVPSLAAYCDHDGIFLKTFYRLVRLLFRSYARRARNAVRALKALWFLCNAGLHAACGFSLLIDSRARHLLRTMKECDALWASGGGYIGDPWFWGITWPMLVTWAAFKWHRKFVVLTGQQIGPLTGPTRRRLVAHFLRHYVDVSYVRENESAELLGTLGIDSGAVEVLLDDAGTIPPIPEEEAREILSAEVPDMKGKFIAAHYRVAKYNGLRGTGREFASFLDFLVEHTGMDVVFVSLSYAESVDDRTAAEEVISRMTHSAAAHVLSGEYEPRQIKGIVGLSEFAVGVSHHFALFSMMMGVPTFCAYKNQYYAHKFRGLTRLFARPDWLVPIDELNSASKRELALELVRSSDGIVEQLGQSSDRLSSEWEKTIERVIQRISLEKQRGSGLEL